MDKQAQGSVHMPPSFLNHCSEMAHLRSAMVTIMTLDTYQRQSTPVPAWVITSDESVLMVLWAVSRF